MKGIFHSLILASALAIGETVSSTPVGSIDGLSPQQSIPEGPASINNQEPGDVAISSSTTKQSNSSTTTPDTSGVKRGKTAASSSALASLRRIKKEYKDAVQMGICYDWVKGRLITSASTKRQSADCQFICLGPLATNLRHWHFSFRGVKNSLYESGIYHGRILLPKDCPATPPRVQLWTPSGRFKPLTDICLSASAHHPESWTPRWTVLSLVHALRLHMLTNPQEIGGIVSSAEEILEFSRRSLTWKVSWVSGKTRVTVDHAKLLQQGLLNLHLDAEDGDKESSIVENADDLERSLEESVGEETVPIPETKDDNTLLLSEFGTATSEKHLHAIEAAETLEKAKLKIINKRATTKKKKKTKTFNTSGLGVGTQRRKSRLRAGVNVMKSAIFATPLRAGLFWFFLMILVIMPR